MKIKQETIDKIKKEIDIVDIISDDVSLKKKGSSFWGICPLHDDHNASLCVSPTKQIWKCFSCGKGGDAFAWLKENNNMDYYEALESLAKKYGIEVKREEESEEDRQRYQEYESIKAVAKTAQDLFVENLHSTPEALKYIKDRGLSDNTIEEFGLGYAFDYGGLTKKLIDKGFQEEYIIKTGLRVFDESKGKGTDVFWKRILFPFYNKRGEIIGYTGRTICDEKPKYKNTGDTALFKKGSCIFGLYQAAKSITASNKVYVVEGQMDVLSMHQIGIHNVVAGSGTAFTHEQRKLLRNLTNNVVFLYDGDEAGLRAAEKNLKDMISYGFNVQCITLPDGKDPDDLAKEKGSALSKYLDDNEKRYVEFLCERMIGKDSSDVGKVSERIKKVLEYVLLEPEKMDVDACIKYIAKYTGIKAFRINSLVINMKKPETPESFAPGIYGLDLIGDLINKEKRTIYLTNRFDMFRDKIGEEKPYVFYFGCPERSQIQKLNTLAEQFEFHLPDCTLSTTSESDDIQMMKEMFRFGMAVDVRDENVYGFLQYYIEKNGEKVGESFTDEDKNIYITRCAEMAAYAKEEIRITRLAEWAKTLGTKEGAFKKLIEPYLKKVNIKKHFQYQTADVYDQISSIDTEKVPDYVSENKKYSSILNQYGYYPVINKDGVPVCYMFRNQQGSFKRVADFFMEAMIHVHSDNKDDNKRIVKLNSLVTGKSIYIEWVSSTFARLSTIKEQLINAGKYNFTNGTAADFDNIWTSMSYDFEDCERLQVFGQQPEGCFCFANGIFQQRGKDWEFDFADELGLMKCDIKEYKFYSPSFSKVHIGKREDEDLYEQDRWLVYTDTPMNKRISFAEWAALMDEVYKINDNGKWAILYGIMSAFRSDIYKLNRLFTAIFLLGPTMSGKTQIAISIRSLFVKPEAPAFNLTSGTDAAFFSVMERFRDVPQVMEEYNDSMISDNKFQGLKSITYDGDGKQKRKSATSNDIETSKVNASVILLGQEAPQKDDNALSNRVILLEVPKRDSINDEHAKDILEELKQHEKDGLSYLLLEILKLRPIFAEHYGNILRECNRALQTEVERQNGRQGDQTRVINTVSMILATCKLLITYAPHLELPFTYDDMFRIAVEKVKWQVGLLVQTDKLALFFNKFDYLIGKSIVYGRDYKIENVEILRIDGKVMDIPPKTKILYFNASNIHHMYSKEMTGEDHPLSLTTLNVNLKSSPAFLGITKGTRFRWMEAQEVAWKDVEGSANGGNSMAATKQMHRQEKITSAVVMNYDILREIMQIDFERDVRSDEDDDSSPDTTRTPEVQCKIRF